MSFLSQASGPSILNFLPWTIRALSGLGWGHGTGSFLCLEGVARGLFNLFQMNVLWRTCCNMYKREISILCSFFFPTLFLWDWYSKRLYTDGELVRGIFSMVRTLMPKFQGTPHFLRARLGNVWPVRSLYKDLEIT